MAAEKDIRKVSALFYEGLNRMANGDASTVMNVWSRDGNVTAMHPIGGRVVGFEEVRNSFDQVAGLATEGEVHIKDQLFNVVGDVATELGVEYGHFKLTGQPVNIEHRVTNVYHRENGEWKLIHHHTDTSPAMLDALSRLQIAQDRGKADFPRTTERIQK